MKIVFGLVILFAPMGCFFPGSTLGESAEQVVVVEVVDNESGAVENADVTFRRDFRQSFTIDDVPNDDSSYLRAREQGGGTTDADGRASLVVPTTAVCHVTVSLIPGLSSMNCPDPLGDRVTDTVYLFGVQTESVSEYFSLVMRPGASLANDRFTLTIVSIGEATPPSEM
jgi:hypothetical protein